MNTKTQSVMTFDDLVKIARETKDAREQVMGDMVKLINDDKHLLKMSRLNQDFTYYVVKHLIIARFFLEYWSNIQVNRLVIVTKTYPFYDIEENIIDKTTGPQYRSSYRKFIEEMLSLTISYEGQGRKEILQIIRSAEDKIREDEYNKPGKFVRGVNE